MISVVKSGKEKIYFTKCPKCASELQYEFSDVEFIPPIDDFYFETKNIVCPICGKTINVSLNTKEELEKMQENFPIFSCRPGCG